MTSDSDPATEQAEELMQLIQETLKAWDSDPDLDIYLDGGTLTADVEDLKEQLAILTVATIDGVQD